MKHVLEAVDEELYLRHLGRGNAALHVGGREIKLTHIGSGGTAEAFRAVDAPRDVYVVVPEDAQAKNVAEAAHRRDPTNPHLPAVEWLGYDDTDSVYRMPYYNVPLREASSPADSEYVRLYNCSQSAPLLGDDLRVQNEYLKECAHDVSPSTLAAVDLLVEEAAKHKERKFSFDFLRNNVGTDAAGNLVLLDVLYEEAADPSSSEGS